MPDDATDSKLCKIAHQDDDDAVSLLEERDKPSLQSMLEQLEAPKSGNKDELALRIAEHVQGDGSVLNKELRAPTVRDYLRRLKESLGGTDADRAARLANALGKCYRERMSVKGYRWDLKFNTFRKGSTKHSLEKLKTLCKQRCPDQMNEHRQYASTLITLLQEFRNKRGGGGGGDEDDEEEGESGAEGEVGVEGQDENMGDADGDDGAGDGDGGEQLGEEEAEEQSGGKREVIDWDWLQKLPPRSERGSLLSLCKNTWQIANSHIPSPTSVPKLVDLLKSVGGPSREALCTLCAHRGVDYNQSDRRPKLAARLRESVERAEEKAATSKRKRAEEGKAVEIDIGDKDLAGGLEKLEGFDDVQVYTESKKKLDKRKLRFEKTEHINVEPVYLADRPEYANERKTIKTSSLQKRSLPVKPSLYSWSLAEPD